MGVASVNFPVSHSHVWLPAGSQRPISRRGCHFGILGGLALLLAGCGTFSVPGASALSDPQVAILDVKLPSVVVTGIWTDDPRTVVYEMAPAHWPFKRFLLMPGRYVIGYDDSHTLGPVELKAGHVYQTDAAISCTEDEHAEIGATPLMCRGRGSAFTQHWIEDRTTGEVVAGEKA
jgi:hypothetical protein